MTILTIYTKKAPSPIGQYSQAIIAGDYLFISCQIGINPKTGKLVKGGIKKQTNQAIDNIEAILNSVSLKLNGVIKTEIYIIDLDEVKDLNDVYSNRFVYDIKPARATIQVVRLPKDAKVEISGRAI